MHDTTAIIDADTLSFIRRMKDRQEILDCLHRYTRGVDRFDRDLMLSAYHADAIDQHGVAEGVAGAFVDWAIGWHGQFQNRHQHIITNHTIDLDGDTAHGETYYIFWGENREGPPSLCFGRYVDRFERRDGRWAIAHRVCVNEKVGTFNETALPPEWAAALSSTGPCRRDGQDISYARPLTAGQVQPG
ncbi:nuclear transport factor 2 family protein [Niveispirillum fermenti]|uniref:nuclear transport factor 2 family protein n=1 Tax=Niveispirillum fermenti TaxID=1233113 RepID=UPI003A88AF36